MAVQFLIDSASDILPDEALSLGITCLPMQVTFGNEAYADGVTLSHEDFYKKLGQCKDLPTTSQISPAVYEESFAALTANGDSLVVITLSSRLSGTYQSALIAAEDYEGKVFVVDSLNATVGERILLLRGLELAKQGLSAKEIADTLDEEKNRIRLVAIIDTLEYLKKGGRISAAAAFAGAALGIKPAISVREGLVVNVGKARGTRQCQALLDQLLKESGEIDWARPVANLFSANADALELFLEEYPEYKAPGFGMGCTIGTHIGPGAYGMAFFEK